MSQTKTNTQKYEQPDILLAGTMMLLHILMAFFYRKVFGLSIHANTPWSTWDWFWQTLPIDLLKNDLLNSIWHLHAQPPLYNFFGGILAKLFFPYHLNALYVTHILMGGLLSGFLYLLAAKFAPNRTIAIIWALAISQRPALYLYEAYILYSLLTTFLITTNLSCILWYSQTKSTKALYFFIITLNILILTRSSYHIILLPLALLFVWLLAKRETRRRVILISILFSSISLSVYMKNHTLFGFFGASSWSGQSLWNIASASYSEEELFNLSEAGVIDPMVAKEKTFSLPSEYKQYGFTKNSDIKALSNNDLNNINIITISTAYQRNALHLIKHDPKRYAETALAAFNIYALPSSSYGHLTVNYDKVINTKSIYMITIQNTSSVLQMVLILAAILFYSMQIVKVGFQSPQELLDILQNDSILFWAFLLILYSVTTSCLLEIGENMRFKFDVEQILWIFIPVVLSRVRLTT